MKALLLIVVLLCFGCKDKGEYPDKLSNPGGNHIVILVTVACVFRKNRIMGI